MGIAERLRGGKAFKTGLITVKFKGKSLASLRFQIQRGVTTEDISDSENNPARRSIHSLSVPFNLDYFLFTGNTVISRGWARGLDQLALEKFSPPRNYYRSRRNELTELRFHVPLLLSETTDQRFSARVPRERNVAYNPSVRGWNRCGKIEIRKKIQLAPQ